MTYTDLNDAIRVLMDGKPCPSCGSTSSIAIDHELGCEVRNLGDAFEALFDLLAVESEEIEVSA